MIRQEKTTRPPEEPEPGGLEVAVIPETSVWKDGILADTISRLISMYEERNSETFNNGKDRVHRAWDGGTEERLKNIFLHSNLGDRVSQPRLWGGGSSFGRAETEESLQSLRSQGFQKVTLCLKLPWKSEVLGDLETIDRDALASTRAWHSSPSRGSTRPRGIAISRSWDGGTIDWPELEILPSTIYQSVSGDDRTLGRILQYLLLEGYKLKKEMASKSRPVVISDVLVQVGPTNTTQGSPESCADVVSLQPNSPSLLHSVMLEMLSCVEALGAAGCMLGDPESLRVLGILHHVLLQIKCKEDLVVIVKDCDILQIGFRNHVEFAPTKKNPPTCSSQFPVTHVRPRRPWDWEFSTGYSPGDTIVAGTASGDGKSVTEMFTRSLPWTLSASPERCFQAPIPAPPWAQRLAESAHPDAADGMCADLRDETTHWGTKDFDGRRKPLANFTRDLPGRRKPTASPTIKSTAHARDVYARTQKKRPPAETSDQGHKRQGPTYQGQPPGAMDFEAMEQLDLIRERLMEMLEDLRQGPQGMVVWYRNCPNVQIGMANKVVYQDNHHPEEDICQEKKDD